jgi:hypothetical protein
MAEFLKELDISLREDSDTVYVLNDNLIYESDIVGRIVVPRGFQTDFASVPRIPIVYMLFGDRAHREAVIHDALYRIDYPGNISFNSANRVFLEAMKVRGKPFYIRWPMYIGVCTGGWPSFNKRKMNDELS